MERIRRAEGPAMIDLLIVVVGLSIKAAGILLVVSILNAAASVPLR